ncbi:macrolide transporter subunit MacA, partial [Escherichia coli]|nr:macrolide transporter subunit MacA [Escherichia coli]
MTWFKGHKRRWIMALIVAAVIAVPAVWHFGHPTPTQFKTVKVTQG